MYKDWSHVHYSLKLRELSCLKCNSADLVKSGLCGEQHIHRRHQEHDSQSYQRRRSYFHPQENNGQEDLQRAGPSQVDEGCHIVEALGISWYHVHRFSNRRLFAVVITHHQCLGKRDKEGYAGWDSTEREEERKQEDDNVVEAAIAPSIIFNCETNYLTDGVWLL